MVQKIPQKLRAKILYEAGHKTPASLKRRGKIPIRSGSRYISEFNKGGSWERKPYKPRGNIKERSKLTKKIVRKARDRKKIWSSREIASSIGTSDTFVRNVLHESGFTHSGYKKKIYLTKERKDKRLSFAQEMLSKELDWGFTIFTDECSFWLSKCKPNRLWTEDPTLEQGTGTHGPKLHCWGAISARGALPLVIFEDNLEGETYVDILTKKIKLMHRMYSEGFIWQMDGSGVHRADIVHDYVYKNMPQTLNWPGYSPDLSPIENIWAWLKAKVNKEAPKTINSLKSCIKKYWRQVTPEFLAPYIDSMPERMNMVIENEGGKIKY
jgi:hypothetical protein